MKMSVSIPDELWRQAAGPEESASQVIQAALSAAVRAREAEAQRLAVPESLRGKVLAKAVSRYHEQVRESFEAGYACGGAVLDLLDWPEVEAFRATTDPLDFLKKQVDGYWYVLEEQRGFAPPGMSSAEVEEYRKGIELQKSDLASRFRGALDAMCTAVIEHTRPGNGAAETVESGARRSIAANVGDDIALEAFRELLDAKSIGYEIWAKGFSLAIEDARAAVLDGVGSPKETGQ